ncbi:MAG TPA: DUF484 family protein [Caulobacteraceae bacterium]|nr:DUF484 family protein [Caulobacteraceae bacterium]
MSETLTKTAEPKRRATPRPAWKPEWRRISTFLRERPALIREDSELLADLGLKVRTDNVLEFGPAALARLSAAKTREKAARRALEATARANFAAQAQTHAAVIDLLEARNHADLARRIDETARLRFGLVGGVIAIEAPEAIPAGWRSLTPEGADVLLGPPGLSRMGEPRAAQTLFGELGGQIGSVALARITLWEPARQGVLAFGASEADAFTEDMGAELIAFLARVVERTAERWPAL